MKEEIIQLLNKIIDSDLSKDAKEKIVLYYMLPKEINVVTNIPSLKDFGSSKGRPGCDDRKRFSRKPTVSRQIQFNL
jgi:hypothetical protein